MKENDHAVIITQGMTPEEKIDASVRVRPSENQVRWQRLEYIAFIHYGMNTHAKRAWGDKGPSSDPNAVNPSQFDAEQWVRVLKDAGMKMIIPTVKHHDGFCLWPTESTDYNISKSCWKNGKGDMVREIADACQKYGMKLGLYISPWDRNDPSWDTPAYNTVFSQQLRELCTKYGEISEFWFDGACGEKAVFERVNYDFEAFYDIIQSLQPNCVVRSYDPHLVAPGYDKVKGDTEFSGSYLTEDDLNWRGIELRWCGNEAGNTREAEWSVFPITGPLIGTQLMGKDLGSRKKIEQSHALAWFPAETNTTLHGVWFWKKGIRLRPIEELIDIYFSAVGGNSLLLLNVAPDDRGLIPDEDVDMLMRIRKYLDQTFQIDYAANAVVTLCTGNSREVTSRLTDGNDKTFAALVDSSTSIEITLPMPAVVNTFMIQEDIRQGQRVERFVLDCMEEGSWRRVYDGTVIGYKKLARFKEVTTDRFRVSFTEARATPILSTVGLYCAPIIQKAPDIRRDGDGVVTISTRSMPECIYYTTDGTEPTADSKRYNGPFQGDGVSEIQAYAVFPKDMIWENAGKMITKAEFGLLKKNWRIVFADNEKTPASNAIDGNTDTNWTTKDFWDMLGTGKEGYELPHEIQIDIGEERDLTGFIYTPNQASAAGHIFEYAFYVSAAPDAWGTPVANGTFDNTVNDPKAIRVEFGRRVQGRYVRLVALSTVNKDPVVCVAELDLLE